MKRKILCVMMAVTMLLSQVGCSSKNKGDTFRYDIPSGVKSLDPQFSTDQNAAVIINNIYEGLLKRKPDGQITSGIADSYKTSPDARTYTFYLRDSKWSDGSPITSYDFAFGFKRLFMAEAVSPYAQSFISIKGAKQILEGTLSVDKLGVSTPDEKTFVVQLEHPDPFFLQLLCTPAAMPCSENFFEETRGKYGLSLKSMLSNGPFKVTKWDNEKVLVISRNEDYYDVEKTKALAVYFYIAREDPTKLLFKGKSDISKIGYDNLKEAQKSKFEILSMEDTTWVLAFNQKNELLADERIRSALQGAIDREKLVPIIANNLSVTSAVVPPQASIYEKPYRQLAGPAFEPIYNPIASKELFTNTLAEKEINKITGLQIIVPDYADTLKYSGFIQQMWQANLALFANIEEIPSTEFTSRVASGNYDIALMPLKLNTYGPQGVLSMFTTNSPQNYVGFSDQNFDNALAAALSSTKLDTAIKQFTTAEDILLESAVIVPLYSQTNYYAITKDAEGIEVSPFGDIYFKNAKLK